MIWAGFEIGIPALTDACLAGFWPCPAVKTWPKITSSISSNVKLDWLIKFLITSVPSLSALKFFNEPLYVPIGVRNALTITISCIKLYLFSNSFNIKLYYKV